MTINVNAANTAVLNNAQTSSVNTDNTSTNSASGTSFLDTLKQQLDGVNDKQIAADDITQSFIKGDEKDVQKVMLATQEAKLSLEMAVQIRNKLVDAYDAFNRMQI